MKKIFLNLILIIILATSAAFAADNNLNAVILEGSSNGYNVILRTDKVANIKKNVLDDGTLLLNLKNISTALNMDTKYINTADINNIVIENDGNNDVNIYIQGKDVADADIIFDTPAAEPVVVKDGISKQQIGWIAAAFVIFMAAAGSFRKSVEKDVKNTYISDLTEREIKMYKEYKSDILTSAKIDNKLKKQILEREKALIQQKPKTIRSLQKMSCR